MPKKTAIIDVSNLSTDPHRWVRTGIQEYNYRTLVSFIELRSLFPEWEIILHPRFRFWGIETNSAKILNEVEDSLGLPSEEIWGYNLRRKGYYVDDRFSNSLTKDADVIHLQSILDVKQLIKSKLPAPQRARLTAIIYDLVAIFFPEFFGGVFGKWYRENYLDPLGNYAEQLICISRSTAIDLTDFYQGKIMPTVNFLKIPAKLEESTIFTSEVSGLVSPSDKYIIALGSLEPRKNIITLIEGWEIYRLNTPNATLKLLLVGGTGWLNSDIFARIKNSRLADDIILPGYISDAELPILIRRAACLAMISHYEGFGLPAAQAYELGTPVLTHIGSSLPEACNLKGIFVNPADPWSVAAGIRNALMLREKQPRIAEPHQNYGWTEYTKAILSSICQHEN